VDWAEKQRVWNYMDRKCPENSKSGHKTDLSKYACTKKEMLRGYIVEKLSYHFWDINMTG